MTEDDYFSPMPTDDELTAIFGLTRQEAGRLWCAIRDRRFQIFEKVKQRREQNKEREQRQKQQRQSEPQKKEDDWLLELLILLIILRQKQRLSLNHQLIMSLVGIVNLIDDASEMQDETKPESKLKL